MKKLAVGFFILALSASWIFSQDQPAKAEKKVFKSEENNKLYVNKDLGIYLWISTSPDSEAEKIRLISDTSKKHSNPMYFDTEGYNTIRSPWLVDTITKKPIYPRQDIIFEVYADGRPPVNKAVYHSSTTRLIDGKRFYGNDLGIEIHSSDAVSGVESTKYSLNSKPYAEYKEKLIGFHEGENILTFYSTDQVGNQGEITEEIFYIDNAPPITEFKIDGLTSNKYVSASTSIQLISKDSLSGVKAIYYRINNGKINKYYKPVPVRFLGTSKGTISFYAVDNLGNKENEQVIGSKDNTTQGESGPSSENVIFEFYVDQDPPDIELLVVNDSYQGKYNFISSRSKIKIDAQDEKAGVDKIVYSINSKLLDKQYNEPFSLEKEGLKYLRVKATDYVGNVSPVQIHPYFCDITPPNANIIIGSPKFSSRDTLFVSTKTKFSISAIDNQSGVQSIQYSIDSNKYIDYNTPFYIDKPGLQTISYFANDHVNNKDLIKTQRVFVDHLPPIIHYHFSVESIGNKTVRDEIYTIFPANVMLYIAATDASSGGEKIEYKINEGTVLTANPIKSLNPGNYLVEVGAFDVLGNKSVKKIKFAIEE